jgi:hypothetical protein
MHRPVCIRPHASARKHRPVCIGPYASAHMHRPVCRSAEGTRCSLCARGTARTQGQALAHVRGMRSSVGASTAARLVTAQIVGTCGNPDAPAHPGNGMVWHWRGRGTRISPVRAAFVLCVTSPMVFGCATGTRPCDALAWLSIYMVLPQCRDRIPGRSQSHVPFEVLFCLLHGTKPACWLHEPLTHL